VKYKAKIVLLKKKRSMSLIGLGLVMFIKLTALKNDVISNVI